MRDELGRFLMALLHSLLKLYSLVFEIVEAPHDDIILLALLLRLNLVICGRRLTSQMCDAKLI